MKNNKNMNKKRYEAPTIKVVPFRMEYGYAGSFKKTELSDQLILFEAEDNRNEQYIISSDEDFWN